MATTKTSIRLINTEKNKDTGANSMLLKIKISDIRLNIIICPAEIFANNLIINEIGFIKIPNKPGLGIEWDEAAISKNAYS